MNKEKRSHYIFGEERTTLQADSSHTIAQKRHPLSIMAAVPFSILSSR